MPLLVHGVRGRAGAHSDEGEEDEADTDANGSVEEDLLAFAWGRESPGAVGSECNPVR